MEAWQSGNHHQHGDLVSLNTKTLQDIPEEGAQALPNKDPQPVGLHDKMRVCLTDGDLDCPLGIAIQTAWVSNEPAPLPAVFCSRCRNPDKTCKDLKVRQYLLVLLLYMYWAR